MSLDNIPQCDVFHPNEEEFKNFVRYVTKCQKITRCGIFKIVPPKSWKARKDNYKNIEFHIPYPIEQIVTGTSGIYEVFLIQREARSLNKYKKVVESFDAITLNKKPIEIEKLFWKNLKLSAPLYGADTPGCIFDKGVDWNLTELDTILKKGLDSNDILGVTTPYIYFGAWKTLFAWHKEDMDLYSINYNHLGKPKFWYAVPSEDGPKFEEFMKKTFPEAYKECPEFLRHKTFLIHPEVLLKQGIKLHKCYQNKGEFVITLAGGYHCGFNVGFNIAEAVNFALKPWIEIGKKAKACNCRGDSVNINMMDFIGNLKTRSGSPAESEESTTVSISSKSNGESKKKKSILEKEVEKKKSKENGKKRKKSTTTAKTKTKIKKHKSFQKSKTRSTVNSNTSKKTTVKRKRDPKKSHKKKIFIKI